MSFANDTIIGTAHGPETCQRFLLFPRPILTICIRFRSFLV